MLLLALGAERSPPERETTEPVIGVKFPLISGTYCCAGDRYRAAEIGREKDIDGFLLRGVFLGIPPRIVAYV